VAKLEAEPLLEADAVPVTEPVLVEVAVPVLDEVAEPEVEELLEEEAEVEVLFEELADPIDVPVLDDEADPVEMAVLEDEEVLEEVPFFFLMRVSSSPMEPSRPLTYCQVATLSLWKVSLEKP